jgi:AraC-like DNA-binding protein
MISARSLREYAGAWLSLGESFLYAPPHPLLSPHISCYTVSFPTPETMSDAYAILPSASSTIVASAGEAGVSVRLRGVNTVATNVGAHANRMRMLLLIEFRPGCLHPFLKIDQSEILNTSLPLAAIAPALARSIARAAEECASVGALFSALDALFLPMAAGDERDAFVQSAVRLIRARRGNADREILADEFHYGERQIRRAFVERVGIGPKALMRIARVNCAARLIRTANRAHADVAARTGYFDQPHLIRDFREICGVTPLQYARNMSDFYNDAYKL